MKDAQTRKKPASCGCRRSGSCHGGRLQCRGFTIIELVIVIVVIGILAAMTLPRMIVFTEVGNINTQAYQDVAGQSFQACVDTAISAGKVGDQITSICGAETSAAAALLSTSFQIK